MRVSAKGNTYSTGASGYIGGDILHVLRSTDLEYKLSLLVRDEGKASLLSNTYPGVRIVIGDLDDVSLVEEESSQADVIVRTLTHWRSYGEPYSQKVQMQPVIVILRVSRLFLVE